MINFVLIPFLVLIGSFVIYEDVVYGKIRNKWILISLVFGILFNAFIYIVVKYTPYYHEIPFVAPSKINLYIRDVVINFLIAFFISLTLWFLKVWSAGDAKLFSVLCLLLPLEVYKYNFLHYFPSFVIFFNIFIVMLAYILIEFVIKLLLFFVKKENLKNIKTYLKAAVDALKKSPKKYVNVFTGFLAILLIAKFFRLFAREYILADFHFNKTVLYVILFVMFEPLHRFFVKKWIFIGIITVIFVTVIYWVITGNFQEIYAFVHMGFLVIAIILFRMVYEFYAEVVDVKKIHFSELTSGMVLSDRFLRKLKRSSQFNNEAFGIMESDGLSDRQVEILFTYFQKNNPNAEVVISKTIPFTPAIVIGTILTSILKGYIVVI